MSIEVKPTGQATVTRRKRPPLAVTVDDPSLGDDAYLSWKAAMRAAIFRTAERDCKQQVRKDWLYGYWLVQDVR